MKTIISLIFIIICYINISFGFINYVSYDINCNQPTSGVSFGLNEFYCMVNGTELSYSSATTLFTFQIYEENQVNLTTHRSLYCDYPIYSKLFTLDECATYDYSNSNYYVSKTDSIPNIPKSSFVIKEYDSSCQTIQSYWYATNGTVIHNNHSGVATSYLCVNGLPIQIVCMGGSCKQINSSSSCSESNYSSIECS